MSEYTFGLEPYGVAWRCEECLVADCEKTELVMRGLGDAPVYEHACVGCGAKVTLPEAYPTVRWRRAADGASTSK